MPEYCIKHLFKEMKQNRTRPNIIDIIKENTEIQQNFIKTIYYRNLLQLALVYDFFY